MLPSYINLEQRHVSQGIDLLEDNQVVIKNRLMSQVRVPASALLHATLMGRSRT